MKLSEYHIEQDIRINCFYVYSLAMGISYSVLYREARADYPDGCVAVVQGNAIEDHGHPVTSLIEFSCRKDCSELMRMHGIVAFQDYEIPEDVCEKVGAISLSYNSENAMIHLHPFATGVLSHDADANTLLYTDQNAVRKRIANFYLAPDVAQYYETSLDRLPVMDLFPANERLSKIKVHFQEGRHHTALRELVFLHRHEEAIGNDEPVMRGIGALQRSMHGLVEEVSLKEFPTIFIGGRQLHSRDVRTQPARKKATHGLYPLHSPKLDLIY